jgi:hypothetical protein
MLILNPAFLGSSKPQGFDWDTNLVSYWDFDNYQLSPGTITGALGETLDAEGFGNFTSANFTTSSKKSSSYAFTPRDYGMNFVRSISGIGELSLSLWYKVTSNNNFSIFSDFPSGLRDGIAQSVNSSTYLVNYSIGVDTSSIWVNNSWNHIVITNSIGSNEYKVYINSQLIYTGTVLTLGSLSSGYDSGNSKFYDELAIWDGRILTQEEVTQLYNNGTGLFYPN